MNSSLRLGADLLGTDAACLSGAMLQDLLWIL